MHLGYRKTFLVINVLHVVCPEILLKEFTVMSHMKHEERQNHFHEQQEQGHLSQEMTSEKKGTVPMPMFARRPSTMSSSIPVEIPQNTLFGQQRQKISELQFDKFHAPHSLFMLEDKIQESSDYLS